MTNITSWTDLKNIINNLDGDYQLTKDLLSTDDDYTGIGNIWTPLLTILEFPDWDENIAYVPTEKVMANGQKYICLQEIQGLYPPYDVHYIYWYPDYSSNIVGFSGTFNGNGYKIHNLIINKISGDYTGLFGLTTISSILNNIILIDVDITGTSFTGSLVGQNYGIINISYSTGTVKGTTYVGGLIGDNENTSAIINNCYTNVDIIGNNYNVGGFTGYNTGNIYNSYSLGDVISAYAYWGGFVGQTTGTIKNCFSTGKVLIGASHVGGFAGFKAGLFVNNGWFYNIGYATQAIGGTSLISYNIAIGGGVGYIDDDIDWFYDKTRAIYTGVQVPYWDFITPIWYDHIDTFPNFEEPILTFTITSSTGNNGTVSSLGENIVNQGSDKYFSIIPDEGYHIEDVLVDEGSQGAITEYTFYNIQGNHTISATFSSNTNINTISGINRSSIKIISGVEIINIKEISGIA